MFKYTRASFSKIQEDVNRFRFIVTVLFCTLYIGYIIYAFAVSAGFLWANIILGAITVCYLIFSIVMYRCKDRETKSLKKEINHIKVGIVLLIKAVTIVLTVYGIYIAADGTDIISVVFAAFSVVLWGAQLLLEIATYIVEDKAELVTTGLVKDFELVVKSINAVSGIWSKFKGEEDAFAIEINESKVAELEEEIERKRQAKAAAKSAKLITK